MRILVIDDSRTVRHWIRDLVERDPEVIVCGEAENGQQAIAQTLLQKPDLITMDLEMPVMDGLRAIEEIMAIRPTPILVLSDVADACKAMTAIERGALDTMDKPTFEEGAAFVARLKMLAGVPVIRHLRKSRSSLPASLPVSRAGKVPYPCLGKTMRLLCRPGIFAIAASTGGPQALAKILSRLPMNFPVPIVIAQHIADGFATGMVAWLNDLCALTVCLAQDGEPVTAGRVYLADSTAHLALTPNQCLCLQPRTEHDLYRPSCDRLLTSAAVVYGAAAVGIILTGMGQDGVRGITAIRQAGGLTLAQDEASSVIFGMNREAILSGNVQYVVPLDQLARVMLQLADADGLDQERR